MTAERLRPIQKRASNRFAAKVGLGLVRAMVQKALRAYEKRIRGASARGRFWRSRCRELDGSRLTAATSQRSVSSVRSISWVMATGAGVLGDHEADRRLSIEALHDQGTAGTHAARLRKPFPMHELRVPLADAPQRGDESSLACGNDMRPRARTSALAKAAT